jgi:RHH-type transcriptional regulator, proline utilization regulon repressor / proline dehydrogenase / delta 1-pyrroline-5-carboxylate dehydrogenase
MRMDTSVHQRLEALRSAIRSALYADEDQIARELIERLALPETDRERIVSQARAIARCARSRKVERSLLEVFLQEFGLSTDEGIALLELAEALLRVPDARTADTLIAEKLHAGTWAEHRGRSDSALVNVATQGLVLSTRIVELDAQFGGENNGSIRALIKRMGEPAVRAAIRQALGLMGRAFVLGRTIEEALEQVSDSKSIASVDMLGEGARTAADAQRYFDAYVHAIRTIAAGRGSAAGGGHGVSVKLSALHPRYEYTALERILTELLPRVRRLALEARASNIQLTIDAEEAARLELSLEIIEHLARDPDLADWQGLGLALQCYSRRAPAVLDWLIALSGETQRRFPVRLVKGAYWDTEIKRSQEMGVVAYPVFTRKVTTDLCYLACARKALEHPGALYPQFATHNAHTIAAVMELAGSHRSFEFQRLHGMGELLYSAAREQLVAMPPVRIYAPVGPHKNLLAYLVRRLLENGANSSFVNRFMDKAVPIDQLIEDPVAKLRSLSTVANPNIPLPAALYGATRLNSAGTDLNDPLRVQALQAALEALKDTFWEATPILAGVQSLGSQKLIVNPANHAEVIGAVAEANIHDVERAVGAAVAAQRAWDRGGVDRRASILECSADAIESANERFVSLLVREAGKTVLDAIAEVREAVDFCRYYATQAREHFGAAKPLVGPTGERNLYSLHGRGAFVCISPWNFPLAIFVGQVTAALAAGNSVLAKPAEQTPLIAAAAVKLLHDAGVPVDVLHLLPGPGESIGAALVGDTRIAGVAMTGSTATAKLVAHSLAQRAGSIIPLIAETGGQNAMIVDSTALPEQVVDDVVRSAFHSAGQRCSALRVLYLQEDVADDVIDMLKGAMDELKVGDPSELSTDIGPVIDRTAQARLVAHIAELTAAGHLLHISPASKCRMRGTFVEPHLFAIETVKTLKEEHFGPLLHVVRYRRDDLNRHLSELKSTGFALTLGVHTRIEAVAHHIFEASCAGNVYVNRNMIGAVVGVQPFGGQGLSGTGPKAGGPLYLQRMATERVRTINTAATGGDVALLRMQALG